MRGGLRAAPWHAPAPGARRQAWGSRLCRPGPPRALPRWQGPGGGGGRGGHRRDQVGRLGSWWPRPPRTWGSPPLAPGTLPARRARGAGRRGGGEGGSRRLLARARAQRPPACAQRLRGRVPCLHCRGDRPGPPAARVWRGGRPGRPGLSARPRAEPGAGRVRRRWRGRDQGGAQLRRTVGAAGRHPPPREGPPREPRTLALPLCHTLGGCAS